MFLLMCQLLIEGCKNEVLRLILIQVKLYIYIYIYKPVRDFITLKSSLPNLQFTPCGINEFKSFCGMHKKK
jgi:hypothetical protein